MWHKWGRRKDEEQKDGRSNRDRHGQHGRVRPRSGCERNFPSPPLPSPPPYLLEVSLERVLTWGNVFVLVCLAQQTKEAERRHFESVIKAFLSYKEHGSRIVSKHEASYSRLPPAHQKILSYLPAKFQAQQHCLQVGRKMQAQPRLLCAAASRFGCPSTAQPPPLLPNSVPPRWGSFDSGKEMCTLCLHRVYSVISCQSPFRQQP